MNRQQELVIEYLQEEIRVLKEQLGKPPRFTEDQRRRLAIKGKPIGRKGLLRPTGIVTLDTLLMITPKEIISHWTTQSSKRNSTPSRKWPNKVSVKTGWPAPLLLSRSRMKPTSLEFSDSTGFFP